MLAIGQDVPGTAAYRIIARELLGEPVPEQLWEDALWDAERRADILGRPCGRRAPEAARRGRATTALIEVVELEEESRHG